MQNAWEQPYATRREMAPHQAPGADNLKGAAICVGTLGAFACNDGLIKLVMENVSELQAVAVRGLFVVPLLAAVSWRRKQLCVPMESRDARLIAGRCVCDVTNTFCFLAAIHRGPMATVAVVLAAQPLTVMAAVAVCLGERIDRSSWLLAGFGMLGVIIVSRPTAAVRGEEGLAWVPFAFTAVMLGTARDLLARRLGSRVPSTQVAAVSAACIGVTASLGGVATDAFQAAVTLPDVWLLAIASVFVAAALVGSIVQMRVGDVGFVQPFRYSFIVWAATFDVAFFGLWPDRWTLMGAMLVVGCGLASLSHERRRQARAATRGERLGDESEEATAAATTAADAPSEMQEALEDGVGEEDEPSRAAEERTSTADEVEK